MDWSQVIARHGPVVWKTAYRLLGHEADAADCFQETFIAAVQLSRRQAVRNWPGLLKRLATSRALDRLRQRMRETARLEPLDAAIQAADGSGDPVDRAESRELAGRLRLALTELPAAQAEALCLCGLEGLSYEDAAEQLGVTVNHVGVLIHRARSALREKLDHRYEPRA